MEAIGGPPFTDGIGVVMAFSHQFTGFEPTSCAPALHSCVMHESVSSSFSPASPAPGALRDRMGVAAAVLCGIHCALLPLAAGLLSAIGLGLLLDERIELALLMLAGLIGVWSLWPAFRRQHGRILPLLLFVAGLLVMVSVRLIEAGDTSLEQPAVVAGAAAVAVAHLTNLRLCRQCTACDVG
jgi:hypothetical protein